MFMCMRMCMCVQKGGGHASVQANVQKQEVKAHMPRRTACRASTHLLADASSPHAVHADSPAQAPAQRGSLGHSVTSMGVGCMHKADRA